MSNLNNNDPLRRWPDKPPSGRVARSRAREVLIVVLILMALIAVAVWRRGGGTADGFTGRPADKAEAAK